MSRFLCAILLLSAILALMAPSSNQAREKANKPKVNFTIGKETTYIDEPLDANGRPDYVAALNKRLGAGVTPANNANVLLWKAIGPRPDGLKMPSAYFTWLQIDEPPERGDYFIDLHAYLKKGGKSELDNAKIDDMLDRATQRPWTTKHYPELAGWLKANGKPLAVAIEATKRTHYYMPVVPQDTDKAPSSIMTSLVASAQRCRQLAAAFSARAMLRSGEGAVDEAWHDLLACHRLARLVGRGGTLIEGLVGVALESVAHDADLVFLDKAKVDAKRIERCLDELRDLGPLPAMADKVNLAERFTLLEAVINLDRHGLKALGNAGGGKQLDPRAHALLETVNWDPALRNVNQWYDRLVAAMREQDRATRDKKLERIEMDIRELHAKVAKSGVADVLSGKNAADSLGKVLGDILIALMLPATRKVQGAADRAQQVRDNVSIAFALAWFQREHGKYPDKLDALTPKYLKQVPQDMFSGKPLLYRPSEKGYLLYSVGSNGQDDAGRTIYDNPPGDDLPVRMPLPALARGGD